MHTTRVVGRSAVLLEVTGEDAATDPHERVAAWYAALCRRREENTLTAVDIVPAARTVLIDGVPDPAALATDLGRTPPPEPLPNEQGPLVQVPTVYDGLDLDDVAERWNTSRAGVVGRHTSIEFRVAFCGFAPGFAYLTGLPPDLRVPRLDEPRVSVPAGSVALADEYAAVYPAASPGGWRLLGHTDLVLFDLATDPPSTLRPGTRVRFSAARR
jgi:KipI family sensor histidine kinase inhibitor